MRDLATLPGQSHPTTLQRLAVAAAALTFVLLLVGGLVHGTGSSLACPDWPLCFGEVFPRMRGGVLFEHSHRLFAAGVGVLTLLIAVLAVRERASDPALGRLGPLVVLMVVLQGVLGGVTVLYRLPTLVSTAHLALSMLFFMTLTYLAWRARPEALARTPLPFATRRWVGFALAAVYAQIVLGALVRHTGAGLACGSELPLCGGGLVWQGLSSIARIQVLHRGAALAVAVLVALASIRILRRVPARGPVRRLAALAPLLLAVQVALGLLSVQSLLGLWQVTAHLGVGALLLADLWLLWLATGPAPRRPAPPP